MPEGFKSRLWLVPLVFAVVVVVVGSYAYRAIERSTRDTLRSSLETVLEANAAAIRQWVDSEKRAAQAEARDPELRQLTIELLAAFRAAEDPGASLPTHPARDAVDRIMAPIAAIQEYTSYGVLARDGTILATGDPAFVGRYYPAPPQVLERVLAGETLVLPPTHNMGEDGRLSAQRVVVQTAAPIVDENGKPIAILGLSSDAQARFSGVLQTGRMGQSGETYAFDGQGVLLSASRFEEELVRLGIIEKAGAAVLALEIRDPGGNRVEGFAPTLPVKARPLTRMAAAAISEGAGYDIDGYPDYRGVPVVGAWTWLPELSIGVASEIDLEEAYAGLYTARYSLAALAAVMALSAVGMLVYSLVLARLQRRYESARKMGRYEVQEKIGEGGMGTVYLAKHALLRRPTALKVLDPDHATEEAVMRFEREVQAVAQLSHPNTIAVYDYGRSPDRTFYYAMEFLEGISLAQLVEADGAQPEARVLHILSQAAGSLAEAHSAKLVHRDLKPSNIMLCARGGLLDFVKVLDFGLVRGEKEDMQLTSTRALTGTPQYLSPEALQTPEKVDARSDIYQMGAVAYILLTGRPVFSGENLVELLTQHLHQEPVRPSEAIGHPISPGLEDLVLRCLRKDPAERPADGGELLRELDACHVEGQWSQADALHWWEDWTMVHAGAVGASASSGALPSGWNIDLSGRSRVQ